MLKLSDGLSQIRIGLVLGLLTVMFGFGLGAVFGIAEDGIKEKMKSDAQAVFQEKYQNDEEKVTKTIDKSWVYLKRAHLHANGIGTTALVLMVLLSALSVRFQHKQVIAIFLGLGGLLYSLFWLLAGLNAPAMGGTSAAKSHFEYIAIFGSSLAILGLLGVVWHTIKSLFINKFAKF